MFLVHFEQLSPRSWTASKTYLRFRKMVLSSDGCSRTVSFQSGTRWVFLPADRRVLGLNVRADVVSRGKTLHPFYEVESLTASSPCVYSQSDSTLLQMQTRPQSVSSHGFQLGLQTTIIFTINWLIVWLRKVQTFNHMVLKWRSKTSWEHTLKVMSVQCALSGSKYRILSYCISQFFIA